MLSKFHIELRRDTIAVGLLVSAICNQSIADTAIVFNPLTSHSILFVFVTF